MTTDYAHNYAPENDECQECGEPLLEEEVLY